MSWAELSGQSALKLDRKPVQSWPPVFDAHRPPLGNVGNGEKHDFEHRIISRENAVIARDFSQRHVHRLDGVGGVD